MKHMPCPKCGKLPSAADLKLHKAGSGTSAQNARLGKSSAWCAACGDGIVKAAGAAGQRNAFSGRRATKLVWKQYRDYPYPGAKWWNVVYTAEIPGGWIAYGKSGGSAPTAWAQVNGRDYALIRHNRGFYVTGAPDEFWWEVAQYGNAGSSYTNASHFHGRKGGSAIRAAIASISPPGAE